MDGSHDLLLPLLLLLLMMRVNLLQLLHFVLVFHNILLLLTVGYLPVRTSAV